MKFTHTLTVAVLLSGVGCGGGSSTSQNQLGAGDKTTPDTESSQSLNVEHLGTLNIHRFPEGWHGWGDDHLRHDAGSKPEPSVDAAVPETDARDTHDAAAHDTDAQDTEARDAGHKEDASHAPDAVASSGIAGLHASGGDVLDGAGNVVRIHGVNHSGSEFACVGGYGIFDGETDAASIAAMKTWNINAVRVPLNEDCWLGINGINSAYSGANYQNAIKTYVDLITASGLYAIVDLHWNAPGTTRATGQQPMADADHAPAFWTSVATAFKGSGDVILELYNEPWPDNNQDTTAGWQCWRDGGTCAGISFPVAGMQTLVTTVRATGATNLVLLGGLEYSNALSQWVTYKPTDPLNNLAAAWHVYEGNLCSSASCFNNIEASLLKSFPIVATEIGDSSCDGSFPAMVGQWLDSHDQGFLAWTWNTWGSGCSNYSLISDYSGTPNGTYGQAYKTFLTSL